MYPKRVVQSLIGRLPDSTKIKEHEHICGFVDNGKTLAVYAYVSRKYKQREKRAPKPTPEWNKDEILSWGHLVAHQFGGVGGWHGKWNLIPQTIEANALQKEVCENLVEEWLHKKRDVEIVVCPRYENDKVVEVDYFIRPQGKEKFSHTILPNTSCLMASWRERVENERNDGWSSLQNTIQDIKNHDRLRRAR
jgi:hypothetical protein